MANNEEHPTLFDLPDPVQPEPRIKALTRPIWTENKAKLIDRYLFYFVMITRHGTYIDGFAGPQAADDDSWAARLVLESEPKWFRHFILCDRSPKQLDALTALRDRQPECDSKGRTVSREIRILSGDFNIEVDKVLNSDCLRPREATFCLLDQRTFECEWKTV